MSPSPPSDPFWRFSLRLWARPGVAQACLWLQDRCGADVNLLLLCCWLASEARAANERFLARAMADVSSWRREAVAPLRRVRRRLERSLRGVPEQWCAPTRAGTKAAELMAERVEQLLLARRAARLPPGPPRPLRASANLDRYWDLLGGRSGPAVERRLAILRAASAGAGPGRHEPVDAAASPLGGK
jgi:uncharacterized protein (TIGR02444 family)